MAADSSGAGCAAREAPHRVQMGVRSGARPSGLPPVRIFLGTEPAQFRATRAFLWSIEQTRDPGRVYEVVLMSELGGFDRKGWTTGFTNYRFAIPHLAGGRGRAIYCDEDQIFLSDPGLLFDLPLETDGVGHGFLAISDTETSVMLIDCERMAELWTLERAQRSKKKPILRATLRERGIRGDLDPVWNARDEEYRQGQSHLLHYSTLHTQPWRPFAERFAYTRNRDEELWFALERSAIAAGFEPYSVANPTARLALELSGPAEQTQTGKGSVSALPWALNGPLNSALPAIAPAALHDAVAVLVAEPGAGSLLEIESGDAALAEPESPRFSAPSERRTGLLAFLRAGRERALGESADAGERTRADGVVVSGGLGELPPEDVPWVIEELFASADRFVFAAVPAQNTVPKPPAGHPPVGLVHTPDWWAAHFEAASARHPELHWQIAMSSSTSAGLGRTRDSLRFRQGGRFPRKRPPEVWLLTDDRPGNTTQSLGLVDELGWPHERIQLEFGPAIYLPNPILAGSVLPLRRSSRRALAPPWPDLVIAAGRRTAPVMRWIGEQSAGRTRTVQLGRKGANPAHAFDLAVSPAHARLTPHPRRLETAGTLTRINAKKLLDAGQQWDYLFKGSASPRIAVLVGGSSHHFELTAEVARQLGRDVAAMTEKADGSVFVTTSRRTGEAATAALRETLPDAVHFHTWEPDQKSCENPLIGYLALADVLVVTGESESMLSEASASGKPVHVYPLPARRPSFPMRWGARVVDWIVERAAASPRNNRGTTRPQQRLELLCARWVEGGYVRPNREMSRVHDSMIERGLARRFDGELPDDPVRSSNEIRAVAKRVRELMGA